MRHNLQCITEHDEKLNSQTKLDQIYIVYTQDTIQKYNLLPTNNPLGGWDKYSVRCGSHIAPNHVNHLNILDEKNIGILVNMVKESFSSLTIASVPIPTDQSKKVLVSSSCSSAASTASHRLTRSHTSQMKALLSLGMGYNPKHPSAVSNTKTDEIKHLKVAKK